MPLWHRAWSTDEAVATARARFREAFGGRADGVWAAPGRVNLVGEHLDYNGGPCLPVALAHRTIVAMRRRDDDTLRLVSGAAPGQGWTGTVGSLAPGRVGGWVAYAAGPVWALAQEGLRMPGFDAAVVSCVPVGAGVSSSAALEGAVVLGVDALAGLGWAGTDEGRSRLAAACVRGENELAGAPTGGMDQTAALRAVAGHALLVDGAAGTVAPIPVDPSVHGLALLVIDTRVAHRLVDGPYADRRAACADAARRLGVRVLAQLDDPVAASALPDDPVQRRLVRHVGTEMERVRKVVALLRAGELAAIGPVLDDSHASLREDFEVSCPELDLAVDAARAAGALGARMTGGGFGGCAIAVVPAEAVRRVAAAVAAALRTAGRTEPAFLLAAVAGAGDRVG